MRRPGSMLGTFEGIHAKFHRFLCSIWSSQIYFGNYFIPWNNYSKYIGWFFQTRYHEIYTPQDTVQQYLEKFNEFRETSNAPTGGPREAWYLIIWLLLWNHECGYFSRNSQINIFLFLHIYQLPACKQHWSSIILARRQTKRKRFQSWNEKCRLENCWLELRIKDH